MSTVQERRIIRDLSAIYLLFGVVTGGWSWGSTMNLDWGNVPQWITAVIAVCATAVAAIGITVQWRLARRRAAIDFFLKTEADKHLVDAYDEFWDGIRHMGTMPIQDFCNSENADVRKHYFAVRKYLNVHELIAVGIKNGMFDGRTCYDFWSRILIRCVEAARPVLDHIRGRPGHEATYVELESLYVKWKALEEQLSRASKPRPAAAGPWAQVPH
jgi:Domain of unknown function (DUF4760)